LLLLAFHHRNSCIFGTAFESKYLAYVLEHFDDAPERLRHGLHHDNSAVWSKFDSECKRFLIG
jgi:hypothetical protein